MKFSSWLVVLLFLLINQAVRSGDFVVAEQATDEETEETKTGESDDETSSFESMTIVASVDGRLHGFDANNNKKWTSDSSGPLSSHHSSGNQLDFSGESFPFPPLHSVSLTIVTHLFHSSDPPLS